jgi:HEAT repeat protein
VLIALALGALSVFISRRNDARIETLESSGKATATEDAKALAGLNAEERRKAEQRQKERRQSEALVKTSVLNNSSRPSSVAPSPPQPRSLTADSNAAAAAPVSTSQFGAYRVDQEVSKLVLGQTHRTDVLASREPEDRRAIEVSLLKALTAPPLSADKRLRAREALEKYGFVARQVATLLTAADAYERAAAAQTLGEIKSPSSLQFLLEALYDADAIVRARAVESIGALQLPTAIGALLDMAQRDPEIPSAVMSRALNNCSVESLDIFGTQAPERAFLSVNTYAPFTGDITALEPAAAIEALPEWMEDQALEDAFAQLDSEDAKTRAAAARALAQFRVQRSIAALTKLAAHDPEPMVRMAAVTSLGEIDHESVFTPMLIAFGDEAREVRAAAARTLSQLTFDRADAYTRVVETASVELMREVARVCIKAGMAGQAIDRLLSEDRRQAYEAFSLLTLLAKSGETTPLVSAIEQHQDVNVRLSAVRLLGMAGGSEAAALLQQIAVRDGVPEKVRAAAFEAVHKLNQTQIT